MGGKGLAGDALAVCEEVLDAKAGCSCDTLLLRPTDIVKRFVSQSCNASSELVDSRIGVPSRISSTAIDDVSAGSVSWWSAGIG